MCGVCVLGSICITFLLLKDLFFMCFTSFYYFVIHNILFHYIHAFIWISCVPFIIFDHLYISWVKHSSFLYPLSIMTKRGRNCGFFFKILHVRGRNTCLCKGEMCFILLGECLLPFSCTSVLWPCLHTLCLSLIYIYMIMYVFFTYLYMCCFFSLFIHMLLILVCNLLFLLHTKMPWWVLFKVFQKYKLSKSTCHKLSSCKVFQEFVLG